MSGNHLVKSIFNKLAFISLVSLLIACNNQSLTAKKLAQDSKLAQNNTSSKEGGFTFKDVTLDQPDEQGRPLWKVKATEAVYTNNNKIAKVQNPFGDLFRDGKVVYRISALEGEIQQDGQKIFLKGQIVATDTENGVVLRGNELEWFPQEDKLIVRNQLTGSHKDVEASAREAVAFSRIKRIELSGQVVANTKEPPLQIKTEHLIWLVGDKKMLSDRAVQIDRYVAGKITDRAFGNQGEVDLNTKIATLKQNGLIVAADPPLDIASNLIVWNYPAEKVNSDVPVRLFHRAERINLNSDKGIVDLQTKIAYLTGKVYGSGQKPPSQMRAAQMTWFLTTESFEAVGNVFYTQTDPPLTLTGPKAVGQFKNQTIVVTGGDGGRVVTTIVP